MANLISAKHPHHISFIKSIKDLSWYYYNKVLVENKSFSFKEDGISCPVSINLNTKSFGIKRNITKPSLSKDEVKRIFSNNKDVLESFSYLLDIVNTNIKFFKTTNMIYNPNKVLIIEFVKPDFNIVSYSESSFNIIGLFDIRNNILLHNSLSDSFYDELCNDLNSISQIRFIYKKNLLLNKDQIHEIKKIFEKNLSNIKDIFGYKLESSVLDYLKNDEYINKEFLKLKYYFDKDVNPNSFKGIISTIINKEFGDAFKDVCQNKKESEGFVFYDDYAKEYIKLVGRHIDFYRNSKFNTKILNAPILPFVG